MANSIGSLALKLTADATDFVGTLEKAQRKVAAFSAGIATKFTSAFRNLTDPFRGIEAGLGSFFDLAGEGSKIREIAQTAKAADRLGTSTETLIVAARAAGASVEDMVGPLFRAQAMLGKTAIASEAVTTPLEKFGLDTAKLRAGGLDELIDAVAKKMPDLATGADQAALATAAFGRAGLQMLPVLTKGSEGLAALKAQLGAQGLLFSREDAQRAIDAAAAMKTLKGSFEGIKTQLALSFAPVVTEIANGLQSWIDKMGGGREIAKAIANIFLDIAEAILRTVKGVSDFLGGLNNLAKHPDAPLQKVPESVKAFTPADFSEQFDWLDRMRNGVQKLGAPSNFFFDTINKVTNQVKVAAEEFDELGREAFKLGEKLRLEADAFGKTGAEMEIFKLEQKGASAAMLEGARAALAQVKGLEDLKKMADDAKSLFEQTRNPVEQFGAEIERLNQLIEEGMIDWDLWGRGMQQAADKFQSAFPAAQAGPAALLQGSAGAISAINQEFNRTERQNPFKEATESLKRIEELQRRQLEELKKNAGEAGLLPNLIGA